MAIPLAAMAGIGLLGNYLQGREQSRGQTRATENIEQANQAAIEAAERANQAAIAEQRRQFDVSLGLTAPQRGIGQNALSLLAGIYGIGQGPFFNVNQGAPQAVTSLPSSAMPGQSVASSLLNPAMQNNRTGSPMGFNTPRYNYAMPKGMQDPLRVGRNSFVSQNGTGSQPGAPGGLNAFFDSPVFQFPFEQGQRAIENSAAARGGLFSGRTARELADYGTGLASQQFGNLFLNPLLSIAGAGGAASSQACQGGGR